MFRETSQLRSLYGIHKQSIAPSAAEPDEDCLICLDPVSKAARGYPYDKANNLIPGGVFHYKCLKALEADCATKHTEMRHPTNTNSVITSILDYDSKIKKELKENKTQPQQITNSFQATLFPDLHARKPGLLLPTVYVFNNLNKITLDAIQQLLHHYGVADFEADYTPLRTIITIPATEMKLFSRQCIWKFFVGEKYTGKPIADIEFDYINLNGIKVNPVNLTYVFNSWSNALNFAEKFFGMLQGDMNIPLIKAADYGKYTVCFPAHVLPLALLDDIPQWLSATGGIADASKSQATHESKAIDAAPAPAPAPASAAMPTEISSLLAAWHKKEEPKIQPAPAPVPAEEVTRPYAALIASGLKVRRPPSDDGFSATAPPKEERGKERESEIFHEPVMPQVSSDVSSDHIDFIGVRTEVYQILGTALDDIKSDNESENDPKKISSNHLKINKLIYLRGEVFETSSLAELKNIIQAQLEKEENPETAILNVHRSAISSYSNIALSFFNLKIDPASYKALVTCFDCIIEAEERQRKAGYAHLR